MPLVRTLAAILAVVSMQCGAAPFALQLGDARVALDAPAGFADTTFTGSPRLQDIAESLTSASNRILVFAISDADLRRFMVGDQMELKRYMLIATPKVSERESLGASGFARLSADALRSLGPVPAAETDYAKYLDAQPPGRPSLLAQLANEQSVLSVLQGSRLPPPRRGEPPAYALSTATLMLIRGKALNLTVYSAYESPGDVDWIRSITARWVEDLKRLNAR
jgi:hypothetical protein